MGIILYFHQIKNNNSYYDKGYSDGVANSKRFVYTSTGSNNTYSGISWREGVVSWSSEKVLEARDTKVGQIKIPIYEDKNGNSALLNTINANIDARAYVQGEAWISSRFNVIVTTDTGKTIRAEDTTYGNIQPSLANSPGITNININLFGLGAVLDDAEYIIITFKMSYNCSMSSAAYNDGTGASLVTLDSGDIKAFYLTE